MMPGARFFFLSHVLLFVLPDGEARGVHYNPLLRAAVLPILPAALFLLNAGPIPWFVHCWTEAVRQWR